MRDTTLTVIASFFVVGLVVSPPSQQTAESDAERVVVTSQASAISADIRSGRRYYVRHQVLTILNRGDHPLAFVGIRGRNAEVFVADGFVGFVAVFSAEQGWSLEGRRDFYRHIAPDSAIALTVAQRTATTEGSAAAVSDGSLELLFADGSSLSI
jgi:hypothetical protein